MGTLVSVVAPVYNEETVLPELVRRLSQTADQLADRYDFEFVFVNDGSRDGSLAVARSLIAVEPRLRVIDLRRNYGQTTALQAGLDAARGAIIVSLDADLQHFPEEIPQFLDGIEAGSDVVCGWRHQRQEGIIRRWPSRAANYLLRRISGLSIHDIGTTFRAYRAEVIRDVRLLGENHRFVPIFCAMAGGRITELPITNIERPVGQSNYGISRTINVFIDLFFLYFYTRYFDRPIRIFGKVAGVLGGLAGLIWLALLGYAVLTGTPVQGRSGWFVLSLFLFTSAVQIILIGVLSEVLVRIYYSGDNHAPYRIRQEFTAADAAPAEVPASRAPADTVPA